MGAWDARSEAAWTAFARRCWWNGLGGLGSTFEGLGGLGGTFGRGLGGLPGLMFLDLLILECFPHLSLDILIHFAALSRKLTF